MSGPVSPDVARIDAWLAKVHAQGMPPGDMLDKKVASYTWSGVFGDDQLRVGPHAVVSRNGHVEATGVIMAPDGRVAGGFIRHALREQDTLVVLHDTLRLGPAFRRHGFAGEFNAHAEAVYRAKGVDRIEVLATEQGGLVWAKEGYELLVPPGPAADQAIHRGTMIREIAQRAHQSGALDDAAYGALLPRLLPAGTPAAPRHLTSMQHVLGLGEDVAARVLMNSVWNGVRYLR